MKKFMDNPVLRRARVIRAVWTATTPKSGRDPNCVVSARRCGSRRTAGFDGVRVNLAIPTSGVAAGPGCMLFSFQGSRTATTVAGRSDLIPPPSRPPPRRRPSARAHRAPRYVSVSVCGRSKRCSQADQVPRGQGSRRRGRGSIAPRHCRSSGQPPSHGARRGPGRSAFFPHGAHVRPGRPRPGRDRGRARRPPRRRRPAMRRRASLRDGDPQRLGQERRQMDGPGRHGHLGQVLRGLRGRGRRG